MTTRAKKKAYYLSIKVNPDEARLYLARWYNEIEEFDENCLYKIPDTFQNNNVTIINYFEQRLTNASAESFNTKIKGLRSQFRGVSDINFFMYRLTLLYA